ncbi:MAG: bifunctional oligoribonuclease/PAP phosphatase NrnA [Spirochaetales bacterium]
MKAITDKQHELFDNFINTHDNFIIAGHKEPDGDCIASSLVLASILKQIGKTYTVMSQGPFRRSEVGLYEELFQKEYDILTVDLKKTGLFIVDCSEMHRLGEDIEKQVAGFDTFIIDHHKTSHTDNEYSIIDCTAPATVSLIQQLYEHRFGEIAEDDARLLFFGLATDTGFFRFLDTTSENIFVAASRLVKAGANPHKTYEKIQSGKPFDTRKLLSIVLGRATQYFDGRLIITFETMADTKKYARDGRDTDMLYQILLATDKAEAVVFLRQESGTQCTAGFRSKGDVDVSAVAAVFGGGGHKNAAGLSTPAIVDTLMQKIIVEFSKIF